MSEHACIGIGIGIYCVFNGLSSEFHEYNNVGAVVAVCTLTSSAHGLMAPIHTAQ